MPQPGLVVLSQTVTGFFRVHWRHFTARALGMTPIEFSSHGLFVGFEHIECLIHEVVGRTVVAGGHLCLNAFLYLRLKLQRHVLKVSQLAEPGQLVATTLGDASQQSTTATADIHLWRIGEAWEAYTQQSLACPYNPEGDGVLDPQRRLRWAPNECGPLCPRSKGL